MTIDRFTDGFEVMLTGRPAWFRAVAWLALWGVRFLTVAAPVWLVGAVFFGWPLRFRIDVGFYGQLLGCVAICSSAILLTWLDQAARTVRTVEVSDGTLRLLGPKRAVRAELVVRDIESVCAERGALRIHHLADELVVRTDLHDPDEVREVVRAIEAESVIQKRTPATGTDG